MLRDCIKAFGSRFATCIVLSLLICTLSYSNLANAKHLLVFGDSLSAAYGMELEQGWVQLLADALNEDHSISNASISGETTVGGLARLPATLQEFQPDIVMLELGANDGLRGYPITRIKENLSAMIELVHSSGADVVLAGISLPPSYGPRYIDQFRGIYRQLAEEHKIPFIDFYDERFITTADYIQADGLHPSVTGQPIIRDSVLAFLQSEKLFEEALLD